MNDIRLQLISKKEVKDIPLYYDRVPRILNPHMSNVAAVFSDLEYSMRIQGIEITKDDSISVLINDEKVKCWITHDGIINFSDQETKGYVFANRLGYVEISICLQGSDGQVYILHSDYISVLIHREETLYGISQMIDYVYHNDRSLLLAGGFKSKKPGDVSTDGILNLDTKVGLIEEVLKTYKELYGYFHVNARTKVQEIESVEDIEHLNSLSHKTLQYIAQHPEYQEKGKGIQPNLFNGTTMAPNKLLIKHNIYSKDIYENRIVLGFILTMIHEIDSLLSSIKKILSNKIPYETGMDDYVHSSFYLFQMTRLGLRINYEKLISLRSEYEEVFSLYKVSFGLKDVKECNNPKPSPLFLSIEQYHRVYKCINRWYEGSVYNLEKENFMLQFMSASALYEVYLLSKMINTIHKMGFSISQTNRYIYGFNQRVMYTNTLCNNTFTFINGEQEITLYYQPVIYDGHYQRRNSIELYRNNSRGFENRDETNTRSIFYYTPDYIIKYKNAGKVAYAIVDAKYSKKHTIINHQIIDLVFRYITSISASNQNCSMEGLYIICGKERGSTKPESLYDRAIDNSILSPKIVFLSVSPEEESDNHYSLISSIVNDLRAACATN